MKHHKITPGSHALLVVGTHSSQTTGYARVMRGLVNAIADEGTSVAVFGIQSRGPSAYAAGVPEGRPRGTITEFDAYALERSLGRQENGFFTSGLAQYVDRVAPEVVVLYNDPVVVRWWLDALGDAKRACRVYLYLDLVADMVLETHWSTFKHPRVSGILTFSPCWSRVLQSTVPGFDKPTRVIPHCVTVPQIDRAIARRAVGWEEFGDAVVFLNLNRNTARKRLDIYAAAAGRFLARDPDADVRFLANSHHDKYHDLHSIVRRELAAGGVPEDRHAALMNKFLINRTMMSDEYVDYLHNACDVGVNCSDGEGWGLCAAETASVGKPVIVSAVGGMADLFMPRSPTAPAPAYLLSPVAECWIDTRDSIGGRARLVSTDDLVRAFWCFMDPENRREYGRRAREHFAAWPTWSDAARSLLTFVGLASSLDSLD